MNKVYLTLSALMISMLAVGQVPKVPFMEIFSSSTCPPCLPASQVYNPLIEEFHEDIAVVKYPMSWPGAGDPYFTDEAATRRSFYGVTGVPDVYINGTAVSYSSLDSAYMESLLTEEVYAKMELKYFIDEDEKTVYFNSSFETMDIFADGDYQLHMSINEIKTFDNATTNGETEFHHIMKKLLLEDNGSFGRMLGDSVVSGFTWDTVDFYAFNGSYRLPTGAQDQVDLNTEHSVEEFDDLEVIMWFQNMTTQEVIQAVIGEEVDDLDELGFEAEPVDTSDPSTWPIGIDEVAELDFEVYPNPAKERVQVRLSQQTDFTVTMTDLLGKQVFAKSYSAKDLISIDVMDMPEGVYMLQITTDEQSYFDRVVVK